MWRAVGQFLRFWAVPLVVILGSPAVAAMDPDHSAGSASGSPEITVIPDSIEFGEVDLEESAMRSFVIRNDGDALLDIGLITLVLPTCELGLPKCLFPTGFTLMGAEPGSLVPGASREVIVAFDPWRLGWEAAPVMIESNDPDEPVVEFFVSGYGVQDSHALVDCLLGRRLPMPPLFETDHNGDEVFDCADIVSSINAGH